MTAFVPAKLSNLVEQLSHCDQLRLICVYLFTKNAKNFKSTLDNPDFALKVSSLAKELLRQKNVKIIFVTMVHCK